MNCFYLRHTEIEDRCEKHTEAEKNLDLYNQSTITMRKIKRASLNLNFLQNNPYNLAARLNKNGTLSVALLSSLFIVSVTFSLVVQEIFVFAVSCVEDSADANLIKGAKK
uniref:Uncharacterized protein n=1 Tax=Glossina pallidipes TaxID=7398 RepID=A0A1A9Z9J9_GLOPL